MATSEAQHSFQSRTYDWKWVMLYASANFERLVLGCINADFCNEILILDIFLIFLDLRDLYAFAPFESNLETTKSASAKRHPGEKQCTGEETIRPQRRSGAWRKDMKKSAKGTLLGLCE